MKQIIATFLTDLNTFSNWLSVGLRIHRLDPMYKEPDPTKIRNFNV